MARGGRTANTVPAEPWAAQGSLTEYGQASRRPLKRTELANLNIQSFGDADVDRVVKRLVTLLNSFTQ